MVLALAIILVFARHVNSWRFGTIYLCAALFYAVNIYVSWIPSLHTTAAVGFVGYLWLGAWSARNWEKVNAMLARCPAWRLAVVAVAAWSLSIGEANLLRSRNYIDPLNTLRISNQIFSIAVVALLLKCPKRISPKCINVREHTFGLYLAHTVILAPISWLALRYADWTKAVVGLGCFGIGIVLFTLTYLGSLILTALLASQPRLCWTVGARVAPQRR
jgi:membrane-bound acyltransferase YfiQ involved in biofilm formation